MSTSVKKIQATKNYRMFGRSDDNRKLDLKKHRKLEVSMKRYGFLASFPVVCSRDANGALTVRDGQHRLAIAESLGLTVYWVEETVDFDVAVINCTAKTWVLRDYAQKFAANGNQAYQEGIEFADLHGLPIGTAFSLLSGTTSFSNFQDSFISGTFKVKDREWADMVAGIYGPIVEMSSKLRNSRFLEACMAVCRVKGFDPHRLVSGADGCREKLLSYSTRDAYLDMIEQIYNFRRKQLVALKNEAVMEMRKRNATVASKENKSKKHSDAAA